MRFSVKRVLAAFAVAACVAAPVMADTSQHSNAISSGGAYSTTPITKKSSATGAPALMNFTSFTNYDSKPSDHPLAARVRTAAGVAASGVASVYGTGTYTLSYYSGYGIYGENYVGRVATHTDSTKGAAFTVNFTP